MTATHMFHPRAGRMTVACKHKVHEHEPNGYPVLEFAVDDQQIYLFPSEAQLHLIVDAIESYLRRPEPEPEPLPAKAESLEAVAF